MTVVPIETKMRHRSGETICTNCRYHGVAVAPEPVVWMECENCGEMKKIFMGQYVKYKARYYWLVMCMPNHKGNVELTPVVPSTKGIMVDPKKIKPAEPDQVAAIHRFLGEDNA